MILLVLVFGPNFVFTVVIPVMCVCVCACACVASKPGLKNGNKRVKNVPVCYRSALYCYKSALLLQKCPIKSYKSSLSGYKSALGYKSSLPLVQKFPIGLQKFPFLVTKVLVPMALSLFLSCFLSFKFGKYIYIFFFKL